MKKLNNKGMTLVELIVSFAIVTVAVVYFSQSLVTTSKLFKSTKEETDAYVEEVYVYRLLEAMFKEYQNTSSQTHTLAMKDAKEVLGYIDFYVYCGDKNPLEISSSTKKFHYKYHALTGLDFWLLPGSYNGCDTLPKTITKLEVTTNDFVDANVWIPVYYFENLSKKTIASFLITEELFDGTNIDGSKFNLEINNYFNPFLDTFVSIAEDSNNKKYVYYTYFDYAGYYASGKRIRLIYGN